MRLFTIGQLARKVGMSVETVRFYERRGLLAEPRRLPSGYRQYLPDTVRRVRFIRHAKQLGFTLKEIQDLLELRVDPGSTCAAVRRRASEKVADIEERIGCLVEMKSTLRRLIRKCRGRGPASEYPILDELGTGEDHHADG